MSELRADTITSATDNTDLEIQARGTGVPNLESGFKVNGTVGVPVSALQTGTDGELITWDASGNPATVATGTAAQVLTSNGAGAAPTFQTLAVAQELTLIGTVTASNDASVTVTGLTGDYDSYLVTFDNMFPTIDDEDPHIRLGDSSGVDVGASDYQYRHVGGNSTTTTVYSSASNSYPGIKMISNSTDRIGKDAGEGCSGSFILHRPSDGTTRPRLHGHMVGGDAQNDLHFFNFSGARKAYIAVDRVNFYFDTNNIVSGKMTVWGIG